MSNKEIKIIGAGPTGSLLALAISTIDRSAVIDLYDTLTINQIVKQRKSYAITQSTRKLLVKINLWEILSPNFYPFNNLQLIDESSNSIVNFTSKDLRKENCSSNSVGWIIDHQTFMKVIFEQISINKNISFNSNKLIPVENNKVYDFIFGADGSSSITRSSLGIHYYSHKYKQACLTAKILIRGVCSHKAYEILREEGPLALLPLGSNVFQVIWTAPYHQCKRRELLPHPLLLNLLASVLPNGIEPDALIDDPITFSLKLSVTNSLFRGSTFLIGESSHSCHPVGGQGLNLSLRDINDLILLFKNSNYRFNKYDLYKYSFKRYLDIANVLLFTDLIVRIFSNNSKLLVFFKSILFYLMNRLSILRKIILSIMTDGLL